MHRSETRRRSRGFTLLEVMVAITIVSMIALLMYGAFNIISKGKQFEQLSNDRSRQGRDAIDRVVRELQTAFLSLHNPQNVALITRTTAFIGTSGGNFDRVDFAAFAHRRFEKDAKESDMCELGFFALRDPENANKMDLVRREQTPLDMDPKRGGVVNVIAENVDMFDLKYLDPMTALWTDTWDSTLQSGQFGRIPLEVRVELVLRGIPPSGRPYSFRTKMMLPLQQPLSFGIPKQ